MRDLCSNLGKSKIRSSYSSRSSCSWEGDGERERVKVVGPKVGGEGGFIVGFRKYLDICFAGDFRGKISREKYPGKICRENISGKYPGKMCRENISGKISRENVSGKYLGKMCRENISGKISHENIS